MRRLLLASLLIGTLALAGDRQSLINDLLAHLKSVGVSCTVVRQTNEMLELKVPGGQTQVPLEILETRIAAAMSRGLTAAEARKQIFDDYASTLKAMGPSEVPLRLKTDGKRIRPRLLSPAYLEEFPWIAHQPAGKTGLEVAYVLDSKGSVRYLNAANLKELGLDLFTVHKLALANLAPTLPKQEIRQALAKQEVVTIQRMDSFDAARLLLVPAALKPGESLAAMIPDRDSLYLAPVPSDGDWGNLRQLAAASDVPPLLNRPLKVTQAGFEKM